MLRQGKSIHELLSTPIPEKEMPVQLNPIPTNSKFYGVVRSKGGSGEKHLVKKLSNELLCQNKKVFICFETHIEANTLNNNDIVPQAINRVVGLSDLTEFRGGVINLNWRSNKEVNSLFSAIEGIKDSVVIFTVGTSSGGPIEDRAKQLLLFCEQVLITIDSHANSSILPAKRLISDGRIDLGKIAFCWWHRVNPKNPSHLLRIFSAREVSWYSTKYLIRKILKTERTKGEQPLLVNCKLSRLDRWWNFICEQRFRIFHFMVNK